jgi:hypothetical protein
MKAWEARVDAWLDQLQAHETDPTRPPDCECWDCRILAALDHPTFAMERAAVQRTMSMERAWNRRR